MEKWTQIPNYPNYFINTLGVVKSTKRKNEIILKPQIDHKGYYRVGLHKGKMYKGFKVHQLMAMTFLDHKPNGNTIVVDHINGFKLDNSLKNLQVITNRENISKDKDGLTGAYYDKRRETWFSCIYIKGRNKYLGAFKTEIEAHNAYQEALDNIV